MRPAKGAWSRPQARADPVTGYGLGSNEKVGIVRVSPPRSRMSDRPGN
jgi:hypothetical protein